MEQKLHLGIIPDGNRRWCKCHPQSDLSIQVMHKLFQAILYVRKYKELSNIDRLSIYGLSMDNFTKRNDTSTRAIVRILNMFESLFSFAPNVVCNKNDEFCNQTTIVLPCNMTSMICIRVIKIIVMVVQKTMKLNVVSLDSKIPIHSTSNDAMHTLYFKTHQDPNIVIECADVVECKDFVTCLQEFQKNTKVEFVGECQLLPPNAQSMIKKIEALQSPENPTLSIRIAMVYDPLKDMERQLKNRTSTDIDVVFRSGGEMRSSGFFPLETLYSEWVYIKKLFPDCDIKDIVKSVREFYSRNRRFGR